jgi:RecA-family ATPase
MKDNPALDRQIIERESGRRLRFIRYSEIDPSPRKDWLVGGIIGEGELVCIFGAPGSGKSVLASDLTAHVAAPYANWLGRAVGDGPALYVAAERAALVKRRLAAWRQYHGHEDIPLAVLSGTIDFRTSRSTVDEIVAFGRDLAEEANIPLKMVVIDTVSRALAGGDENSPKDMGALVGNLTAIQEATGAAVLVLHHIPQDGAQRMRGHGALIGAVDVSISVEKHATARTATVSKTSDGEEGESVSFTLESVDIADSGTTAPVVIHADARQCGRLSVSFGTATRAPSASSKTCAWTASH